MSDMFTMYLIVSTPVVPPTFPPLHPSQLPFLSHNPLSCLMYTDVGPSLHVGHGQPSKALSLGENRISPAAFICLLS